MYPSKTTKKWHKAGKKLLGIRNKSRDIDKDLLRLAKEADEYGNRWSIGYPAVAPQ